MEETLWSRRGFPRPRLLVGWSEPRRWATTIVAIVACVVAIAAVDASLNGEAYAGVVIGDGGIVGDPVGLQIGWVSPLGFVWEGGVRPGQIVTRVVGSDQAGGWRLETTDGTTAYAASERAFDDALRATLPLSLGALILGGLAILLLRGRRDWVPAAAGGSLVLAGPALGLHNGQAAALGLGAAALLPVGWVAWRPRIPVPVSAAVTLAAVAALAWWLSARTGADPMVLTAQSMFGSVAVWGTVLVVIVSVVVPSLRGERLSLARPRIGDIAIVSLAIGLSLVAVGSGIVPLPAVILVWLATVAVVPAWRRRVAERAERTLLADLRERAVIDASEAERAHLARELHDAPLQHLAAIIRRLELIPDARIEAEELRLVADQLRSMATELRPPVLDDLGLAAAIEFLADSVGPGDAEVTVDVRDEAGLRGPARPPAEVELALFRIVQEALGNAARHAQAATVRVHGFVRRDRIELAVEDDGTGMTHDAALGAARRGRLGLASMRRRAEAIDADLSITHADPGTRVLVRWQA